MAEKKQKALIIKRNQMKDQLHRFAAYLRTFNLLENSISELKKRLEKVELIWDNFIECQSEIEILDLDNDTQLEERESFESLYYKIVSEGQELIDEALKVRQGDQTPVNSNSLNFAPCNNVQLPVLQLPTFRGAYDEYMQFHDTFNSLINNNQSINLTSIQKPLKLSIHWK